MGFLERTLRLLRTVRYVPFGALMWRMRARAMRYYFSSPLYGALELTKEGHNNIGISWVGVELIPGNAENGRAIATGKFTFAGVEKNLGQPPLEWNSAKVTALWTFNLHYHEWLGDLRAAGLRSAAEALVSDWLMGFASYHPVAWHPYPTSLRLVAWLTHGKWLLEGANEAFREAFAQALRKQSLYLQGNCEWDLGGNHLLKNLKALVYCGLAVDGQRVLFEKGMGGFLRQVKVQFLPDGAHYERSPLYQAQVLRDVLEVRAVLRKFTGVDNKMLDEVCERAGAALSAMCGADGTLGLFNDSVRDNAAYIGQLLRLSGADDAPELLPDSGYARLQRGKALLLFDGGLVGPDENPGHAHADTLSFEFCHGNDWVFVNGGTYAYQDRLRNTLRSTPAHNTVAVDGESSAEVWGAFRVGRRPQLVTLEVNGVEDGEMVVEGSHDGYRHMGLSHARKVALAVDGNRLRGEDVVRVQRKWWQKAVRRRVIAHFHVHPAVEVRLVSEREIELTLAGGKKAKFVVEEGRLDVKESIYAPQFGVIQATRQIMIHGGVGERDCRMSWQLIVE